MTRRGWPVPAPGWLRFVVLLAVFVFAQQPVYDLLQAWRPSCSSWPQHCAGAAWQAQLVDWCYAIACAGCGFVAAIGVRRLAGWDRPVSAAGH